MDSRSHRFASPGIPPRWEQLPKETTRPDFLRRSLAISSCSDIRTAPLMKLTAMDLSGRASTSLTLKSRATGQNTRSTTASSQPPQLAHQYKATLGFSAMSNPLPVQRTQPLQVRGHLVDRGLQF